jgi:hypothetical protein
VIGRSFMQDLAFPFKAAQDAYGAGTPYEEWVASDFRLLPQDLSSSNKASEHNILNSPTRIVVGQVAKPTLAPDLVNRLSYRAPLQPPALSGGG